MRRLLQATKFSRQFVLVPALLLAAACSSEAPAPEADETEIPAELRQEGGTPSAAQSLDAAGGTPMEERTATIGLLNKRNNLSQDLTMKPGESRRLGNVIVRLSACERTPMWELPNETGAFVQLLVRDTGGEQAWRKVFSGWLFKRSPSLNVVEHPIYDVWVKECAMSFPGEERPVTRSSAAPAPSAPRPAPAATPTPEPEPAAEEPSSEE